MQAIRTGGRAPVAVAEATRSSARSRDGKHGPEQRQAETGTATAQKRPARD